MKTEMLSGLLIPFLGTSLGAACVFFMKHDLSRSVQCELTGFAAGAMIYVVVEELIPEMSESEHSYICVILLSVGYTLMMVLNVVLG